MFLMLFRKSGTTGLAMESKGEQGIVLMESITISALIQMVLYIDTLIFLMI